jgi:transcriptional regulator with XRE-family HTH domain
MGFPELAIRLAALRERYDVDYSALAQRLGVDKTTAWRWFQGAANLPEAKQQLLVSALCFLLAKKGMNLTEDDFHLNNTFEFFSRIGISKLHAALLTGLSLPVPEALIDAARESQEPLQAFVGHYQAYWLLHDGEFARALAAVEKQPDGRVTFCMEWNGDDAFTVAGYLCMIGDELSVIGDRIAGNFRASRSLFTMALDVDFDQRSRTVKGLHGFMPDRAKGETLLRRMVMVPTVNDDVDDTHVSVNADYVNARASGKSVAFLTAGSRG